MCETDTVLRSTNPTLSLVLLVAAPVDITSEGRYYQLYHRTVYIMCLIFKYEHFWNRLKKWKHLAVLLYIAKDRKLRLLLNNSAWRMEVKVSLERECVLINLKYATSISLSLLSLITGSFLNTFCAWIWILGAVILSKFTNTNRTTEYWFIFHHQRTQESLTIAQ